MQTRVTVPIAAKNLEQARRQIEAAKAAGADMLELRVDYFEDLSSEMVAGLVGEIKSSADAIPLIVTCRDARQGGAIAYLQDLRVDTLVAATQAGAEFVDLEYENFLDAKCGERVEAALSQTANARLILSAHDFETKFDDIGKLCRDILDASPGAIPKLVYTAKHINDCFDAFDLLHEADGDRIVFCMGQAGLISRIIAKKLGSFVTFASIDPDSATAAGQLTIEQFRGLYRGDRTDAETELFGVVADPVGHSLSPAIHNACFAEQGMNRLYVPLLVHGGQREFDSFLDKALERKWLTFRGFSVTIPHKQSALEYVRARGGFVEPLAKKIGAANTIVADSDGKLAAYNTDYAGALDAITAGMEITRDDFKDMPVAVVGAGGVSRAIVAGLSDAGADIRIYNRTIEKAERLAAEFDCEFAPLDELTNLDTRLVMNCTSIGMHPKVDATPVPVESLNADVAVFDTVYNPAQTLLLKQAAAKGAKTIDGISMFVNQAMAQFKLFTNTDGNADLMREVVLENLRC
ncbi:MAG: shikimate dehydrogenase [Phycisphaerales bacterium]|nr:MAG: shikimate dehydrogenase [Phycisphaerales bacterium]